MDEKSLPTTSIALFIPLFSLQILMFQKCGRGEGAKLFTFLYERIKKCWLRRKVGSGGGVGAGGPLSLSLLTPLNLRACIYVPVRSYSI